MNRKIDSHSIPNYGNGHFPIYEFRAELETHLILRHFQNRSLHRLKLRRRRHQHSVLGRPLRAFFVMKILPSQFEYYFLSGKSRTQSIALMMNSSLGNLSGCARTNLRYGEPSGKSRLTSFFNGRRSTKSMSCLLNFPSLRG
jgi:hypothetical protein